MLNVKIGDFLNMNDAKRGMGAKGLWLFVPVKAKKGHDQITVFCDNPDEAQNWECAKVKEIKSVTIGHKQVNGNWYTQFTMNVVYEEANAIEAGFRPDLLADNNLPFN